jgi:hypothetical protein
MPFPLWAGIAAGLVHVLSGPDHLVAVAPLAVDDDRPHWRAGFRWGLGHTAGVLVIGGLLLAFRELLPIDAISAYSERIVGLALIAIGVWGAHRATRLQVHRHDHAHGVVHAHIKGKRGPAVGGRQSGVGSRESGVESTLVTDEHEAQHRHPRLHGHARTDASFAMGLLHGLAGSSHVFGVLPALALATRMDAAAFLTGFGVGAIVAMTAFAALVGLLARRVGRGNVRAHRGILYACSISAVVVGSFWLVA